MEWVILGILSAVIYNLWRRVQILEHGRSPGKADDSTSALDTAARILDRHVQDYHNGGK